MSAARVPVSNGARAHWRKWVFALSFVVGPAIGIVLAGLFFLVVACVDQSLSCGADDFLLGTLLFGIYGAPAGLLITPPVTYWYFLVRPRHRRLSDGDQLVGSLVARLSPRPARGFKGIAPMLLGLVLVAVVTGGLLGSCEDKTIAPSIVGYNHTNAAIGHFTVNGRGGGGFLGAHQGGGKFACCAPIPNPWRSGLTATIGWTDERDEHYQERVVPVPEYDAKRTGQFSVHFLRNGDIRVFVTLYGLRHPDYPLKGADTSLGSDDASAVAP